LHPDSFQPLDNGLDHSDAAPAEDFLGVGRKGQYEGDQTFDFGLGNQETQDFLVAQMEAVKIPDRCGG
jgi:hypothetical protein